MTKRTRQIYAALFAAIWLIITVFIMVYLNGYSVDVENLALKETGSIAVYTLPKQAIVHLVDTDSTKKSPALFNQLKPGRYTVEVSIDGYSSWQDTLEVLARQTTEVNPVMLFRLGTVTPIDELPNNIIKRVSSDRITDLSASTQFALSDANISTAAQLITSPYITVLDNTTQQLYLVQETRGESTVEQIAKRVRHMQWSEDEQQLLYHSDFELSVFERNTNNHRTITRQSDIIEDAIWHPRASSIIYSTNGSIIVTETRLTDTPNSVELYSGESPTRLYTNNRGTMLYFEEADGSLLSLELL